MKKAFIFLIMALFIIGGNSFDKEKQKVFDELYLIMTQKETQEFSKIKTPIELKKFVYEFWKKRDPNPATPRNKVKDVYYARLKFAAKNFKEPDKKGWLTDRGRILLLLGPPTSRYLRLMNDERTLGYNTDEEDSVKLAITSGHGFVPNAFQPEEKPKGPNQEKWIYQDINLTLYFVDEIGNLRYRLYNPPAKLLVYLKEAKKYFMPRKFTLPELTISADVDTDAKKIYVHIPLKSLSFIKEGRKIYSMIKLDFYYTRNIKIKPTVYSKKMKVEISQKDIKLPESRITIPINIKSFKGRYIIYVHIKDLISGNEIYKKYRLKI